MGKVLTVQVDDRINFVYLLYLDWAECGGLLIAGRQGENTALMRFEVGWEGNGAAKAPVSYDFGRATSTAPAF